MNLGDIIGLPSYASSTWPQDRDFDMSSIFGASLSIAGRSDIEGRLKIERKVSGQNGSDIAVLTFDGLPFGVYSRNWMITGQTFQVTDRTTYRNAREYALAVWPYRNMISISTANLSATAPPQGTTRCVMYKGRAMLLRRDRVSSDGEVLFDDQAFSEARLADRSSVPHVFQTNLRDAEVCDAAIRWLTAAVTATGHSAWPVADFERREGSDVQDWVGVHLVHNDEPYAVGILAESMTPGETAISHYISVWRVQSLISIDDLEGLMQSGATIAAE